MLEVLLEYANENDIILEFNENNNKSIQISNENIIELFIEYDNTIKIIYKNNSELLLRTNMIINRKINEIIDEFGISLLSYGN